MKKVAVRIAGYIVDSAEEGEEKGIERQHVA